VKSLKEIKTEQRRRDLMQKLETKFARYELRTKKHEVQVVSAHWLILASAVGSVFVLKQRLHNKYVGAMQGQNKSLLHSQ
jgi:hypothetical protein